MRMKVASVLVMAVAMLLMLLDPQALLSAEAHTVILHTSSQVQSFTSGQNCTRDALVSTYHNLNTGSCTSQQGNSPLSMLVTCGANVATRLQTFNAASCTGTANFANGTVPISSPYDPTAPSECITGVDYDYIVQCAEPSSAVAQRIEYSDSSCKQRTSLTEASTSVGTDLSKCYPDEDGGSYASYLNAEKNNYLKYTFSGPNCVAANFITVETTSAGHCVRDILDGTGAYFMIIGAADTTYSAPTEWPPAASNTLVFDYKCSDVDCTSGCRVSGATRLGQCLPANLQTSENLAHFATVCTANTLSVARAFFSDSTCSASSLGQIDVTHANNTCSNGSFRNCGNGYGVASSGRVPSILSSANTVTYAAMTASNCAGSSYRSLTIALTDRCLAVRDNTHYYTFTTNSTASTLNYYNASTSGSQCQEAQRTEGGSVQKFNQCEDGQILWTRDQAVAAGIAIDTTTASNGVNGAGQVVPGAGNTGAASSTTQLSCITFILAAFATLIVQ